MKTFIKILFVSIFFFFVSCQSRHEDMFSTQYRTVDENMEYVYNYHINDFDHEYIGYCYWCGSRCANSGGGWTVCLVFKDKSRGNYILPSTAIRPNSNCTTNEYTTDRIDIRGLTKL